MLALLLLSCAAKAPPDPPPPPPPPSIVPTACTLGPHAGWQPELATLCRVPWAQARPVDAGLVGLSVRDNRQDHPGLTLRVEDQSWDTDETAFVDLPWGPGGLAGAAFLEEGPEGPLRCAERPAEWAVRLMLYGTELDVDFDLGEACGTPPPVWRSGTDVSLILPVPGGEEVRVGPGVLHTWDDRAPVRPPDVDAACVGAAFDVAALRDTGACGLSWSEAGTFPDADVLALETAPLSGVAGEALDFVATYRNVSDGPLVVDLRLTRGAPIPGARFSRDGVPAEVPPGCTVDTLAQGEAFRVQLAPGGTLSVPARAVLRPGGAGLWTQRPGCDLTLAPGTWQLELFAPDGPAQRSDALTVDVRAR